MSFIKRTSNQMMKAITNSLNRAFVKSQKRIRERIRDENVEIWKNTPTYRSLTTPGAGRLIHQFGFPEGEATGIIDDFLELASQSIDVRVKSVTQASGAFLTGGMQIFVLEENLDEILSSSFSYITSEKGFKIDWASWLLREGNNIIISDYIFRTGFEKYSRSGNGIMGKINDGFWRVPPAHSGTIGDNWLTRSLKDSLQKIAREYQIIIETEVSRELS